MLVHLNSFSFGKRGHLHHVPWRSVWVSMCPHSFVVMCHLCAPFSLQMALNVHYSGSSQANLSETEREREIPEGHLWLLLLPLFSGEMWNDETVFIADKTSLPCLLLFLPLALIHFDLYATHCHIASDRTQNYACVCRDRWLKFDFTL